MTQLELLIHWILNRIAVVRGAPLTGVGCSATSEEEVMTIMDDTWHRPTGTQHFDEMKPFEGNLRTD